MEYLNLKMLDIVPDVLTISRNLSPGHNRVIDL